MKHFSVFCPNARNPKDKWKGAQIKEGRVKNQHKKVGSNA